MYLWGIMFAGQYHGLLMISLQKFVILQAFSEKHKDLWTHLMKINQTDQNKSIIKTVITKLIKHNDICGHTTFYTYIVNINF